MVAAEGSGLIDFSFDEAAQRFEARVAESDEVAYIAVEVRNDIWTFSHTEVPKSFQGRGIGSALVRAALQYVRDLGAVVRPVCPFVIDYLRQNPAESDVVHPRFRHFFQ